MSQMMITWFNWLSLFLWMINDMLTHTLFYNFTAGIKAHTENDHLITRGCPLSNTTLWASLSLFTNNFYNFLYYLLPHNQWYFLISITKYPFFILLVYIGIRIAAVLHFNTLSYLSLTESYSFYMKESLPISTYIHWYLISPGVV